MKCEMCESIIYNFCDNCKINLCDAHWPTIHTVGSLKSHQKISIPIGKMCDKNDHSAYRKEMICISPECKMEIVCAKCISSQHSMHQLVAIPDFIENIKSNISDQNKVIGYMNISLEKK
jgi:hypothetical protein